MFIEILDVEDVALPSFVEFVEFVEFVDFVLLVRGFLVLFVSISVGGARLDWNVDTESSSPLS